MSIATELRKFVSKTLNITERSYPSEEGGEAALKSDLRQLAEIDRLEKDYADKNKNHQAMAWRFNNVLGGDGLTALDVDNAAELARRAGLLDDAAKIAKARFIAYGLTEDERAELANLSRETSRLGRRKMEAEQRFDDANGPAIRAMAEFKRLSQAHGYECQLEPPMNDLAWAEEFDREYRFLEIGERATPADLEENIRFAADKLKKALTWRREARTELNHVLDAFWKADKAQKAHIERVVAAAAKEGAALRKHTAN